MRAALAAPLLMRTRKPRGVPGQWKREFEDTFNGNVLNTNIWQPNWLLGDMTSTSNPVSSPGETAAYAPSQVVLSGGNCELRAIASVTTVGANNYANKSGLINTDSRFNFAPRIAVAVEARMFLPGAAAAPDNWPALWLDGQSWPDDGEIDIMEGLASGVQAHIHYGQDSTATYLSTNTVPPKQIYGGKWSTFCGVWWLGDRVDYYYDGVLIGSSAPRGTNYLQGLTSKKFLIINYATSGAAGNGGVEAVPRTCLIDRVSIFSMGGLT